MAKKEGYIIDLNKLWRYEDGNLIRPRMLWANGKEYFAAFSNGSLSYNKAYYEFYLEDTELVALASGVIMDSYVYTSQKTDFDGKVTNIGVTDTLGYIEPNYSLTEERTGTFTVTQNVSGFTLTGTYRQRKDSVSYGYYNLSIYDIDCPTIPANGDSRPLTAYYSYTRVTYYESGKQPVEETIYGSTSNFDYVDVDTKNGGAFDYTYNQLSGSNLGHTEKSETAIAVVNYISISINGMSASWSGSQSWYQEANTRTEYGSPDYNVSIRVDGSDEVLASTTYVMLVASATVTRTYYYTALPDTPKYETVGTNATITASSGATVEPTSISGQNQSVKLSFSANDTTSSKSYMATISANGKSASTSVVQQAAQEEYYWEAPTATSLSYGEIPASGSAISIYVIFTQRYMKKVGSTETVVEEYNTSVIASSITGSKASSSSTAVVSGGTIGASSLGNHPKDTTTPQYNISGGTYAAADGKTYKFSLTGQVVQAKNVKGAITTSYAVGITPSSASLGANGGTLYFTLSATKTESFTWSSGTPDSSVTGGTASVTSTGGTVPSSVSNGGTLTFYNGENTRESNLNFTITASYGGKTATVSVTQAAASYVFDYVQPSDVGYNGGEFRVYLNSYMNGNSLKPTDVSISGLNGASVKSINELSSVTAGNIEVVLNIPNNTGSARNFTLNVVQPNSGRSISIPMKQQAYEAEYVLSLSTSSYFVNTKPNYYQFNGTVNVQSRVYKSIVGKWYYTPINEEGIVIGRTQSENDSWTIEFSGNTVLGYTGSSIYYAESTAAGFAGFIAEFRSDDSSVSFGGQVYNIQ